MVIHVVNRSDSLWEISNTYGVPISTIIEVNGLQSATEIVPGLALYIPSIEPSNRLYQIKPGDTLWQLSQLYDTSIDSILSTNPGINPRYLYVGQQILIPSPIKLEIQTLGFIVPYNIDYFLNNIDGFAKQLTYMAIVSYSFTEEGYAYVLLEDREIISQSRERNIIPLLMIRNFQGNNFDPELVGRVLQNPNYRTNLIRSLLNFVTQRGYGGVSIDFEFIPPPRRNDFNQFLFDLKAALGNLILHVNVHAKTEDIPTNRIIGAYDYEAIGRIADIVAVMTIDYGYPTGPPDPVSPAWWVAQVIRYSITQISPRKLQIAFPLYGYEKSVPSNLTKALSVREAQNLAIQVGSSIQFDLASQSPWYKYWAGSQEQVVWFEDIRSYIAKYRLIDLYGILGTTFWQLTLPAPQNWNYMRDQINVIQGI